MPRDSEITGPMMSATTTGRMPLNAASTVGFSRMPAKKRAMARMMANEGSTVPSSAAAAPRSPRMRYPTKTDVLTAIGPGTDCASVSRSRNSPRSIQLRFTISSRSMRGSMA